MPKMVPFRITVSRTYSFLTASSVSGVVKVYAAISFSFRLGLWPVVHRLRSYAFCHAPYALRRRGTLQRAPTPCSLKSIFPPPVRAGLRPGSPGRPALGVHGHRVLGNVGVRPFDVNGQSRYRPSQAHGAKAQGIDGLIGLV